MYLLKQSCCTWLVLVGSTLRWKYDGKTLICFDDSHSIYSLKDVDTDILVYLEDSSYYSVGEAEWVDIRMNLLIGDNACLMLAFHSLMYEFIPLRSINQAFSQGFFKEVTHSLIYFFELRLVKSQYSFHTFHNGEKVEFSRTGQLV